MLYEVITGINETFIKQRPIIEGEGGLSAKAEKGAPLGDVLIDDATIFCGQFECGALASFEMTRYAAGNKNGVITSYSIHYTKLYDPFVRWKAAKKNEQD